MSTFDLTRIGFQHKQLLPGIPDPDEVDRDWQGMQHYLKEKDGLDKTFEEMFAKVNEPIFKGVEEFVKKSMDRRMFSSNLRIHAATLFLDMQTSDHKYIFDRIERNLRRHKHFHVRRVRADLKRKRNLLELLEDSIKASKLMIMIEQAETIDTSLAELLVGNLKQRLEDENSPTNLIMVLFCVSTKLQELPYESMDCFGKITHIQKNVDLHGRLILDKLFRCPNTTMKLGGGALDIIYGCFLNNDASLANVKVMFNIALQLFCSEIPSSRDAKGLVDNQSKFNDNLQAYHEFLCDQLYCYCELLRAPECWPDDVTDLYEELLSHDTLGSSLKVYDALKSCSKLTPDAILARIRRTEALAKDFPSEYEHESLIDRLKKYRKHFEKDEDVHEHVKEFIDELLDHAGSIKNPLKIGYSAAYYLDECKLIERTFDTVRKARDFETYSLHLSPYYEIVCKYLLKCPLQISANDFWCDVSEQIEGVVREERERRVTTNVTKSVKSTPLKKARIAKEKMRKENPKDDKDVSGLAKSIFLDLLACLEHQHIIKIVRKSGKGLLIKRSVWLR